MKKNNLKAFTLIELMVVIALIWILIWWANFLSFNNISSKDKLETKVIKIISNIETIRNNALLWKWIWQNLIVPEKYKIDFSTSWSWKINYYYFSGAISDFVKYNFDKENKLDKFESISSIKCLKLDWSLWTNLTTSQTWTIIIEWANMTLTWNCDNTTKILELNIKRKQFSKKININTVSWLIK